jgi:hypothetical protein
MIQGNIEPFTNPNPNIDNWGYFLSKIRNWENSGEVAWHEHIPFFFIHHLIREGFRRAGYSLLSEFFQTEEFIRKIMPVIPTPPAAEVQRLYELYIKDIDVSATTLPLWPPEDIFLTGTEELDNPGGHYNVTTGRYTIPHSGYYELTLWHRWYHFYALTDPTGTIPYFYTDGGVTTLDGTLTKVVFLKKGDEMKLRGASLGISPSTVGAAYIGIKPYFDKQSFEGITFKASNHIPKNWMVSDILLGIHAAYNLNWSTDFDAKTVFVEPRDSYLSSGKKAGFFNNVINLSNAVDSSKGGNTTLDISKKSKSRLGWKTGDPNVEKLDKSDLPIYTAQYEHPIGRFDNGTETIEVPFFVKTIHYRASDIRHLNSDINPQIPLLMSELIDEDTILIPPDQIPRILHFAGRRNGRNGTESENQKVG